MLPKDWIPQEISLEPLSQKHYKGIAITKDNFKDIEESKTAKLLYIDGGYQTILKTPGIAIGLIRIAGVKFLGETKTGIERTEFIAAAQLKEDEYTITTDNGKITINAHESTLTSAIERASPETILNLLRRIKELEFADKWSSKDDIIVIDGTLDGSRPGEFEALSKLKNKNILAIAKTSTLVTKSGHSILIVLQNQTNKETWYYEPIYENTNPRHPAIMAAAKLHKNSKHVFRIETFPNQNFNQLLPNILPHAKDPIFRGYPYGLIVADQLARVSNQEKEIYKTKLNMQNKEIWELLEKETRAQDAHDILDNIG